MKPLKTYRLDFVSVNRFMSILTIDHEGLLPQIKLGIEFPESDSFYTPCNLELHAKNDIPDRLHPLILKEVDEIFKLSTKPID